MKPPLSLSVASLLLCMAWDAQAQPTLLFRLFSHTPKPDAAPAAAATPPPEQHAPAAPRKKTASSAEKPAPSKPLSPAERDANTKVQVFLDQALFGPGKIDGRGGEFTAKAILNYQRASGLKEDGLAESLPLSSEPPYTKYTLRHEDHKFVGHLPSQTSEQAKRSYLPYPSFAEFLCERFHCSPVLLAELNPELKLDALKPGDEVTVPAVEPFQIEDVTPSAGLPPVAEFKNRSIYVNRKERVLQLSEQEKLLASFPITPGSEALPTPAGKWHINAICTMPAFRWDEGVLNHGVRTNQFWMLPPGPRNPVGVVWCALNKPGIGIHGTNRPDTIGRASSHGCMRMANWDAIRLSKMITANIPVVIE